MHSRNINKIIAIFFAVYLPLITMGLPLHKHYCQGDLKKMQLLIQPDSCHEDESIGAKDSCCSSISDCTLDFKLDAISSCCKSNHLNSTINDDNGCCKIELEIIKIDFSFIKESSVLKKEILNSYYKPIFFFLQTIYISFYIKKYFIPYRFHYFLDGKSRVIAFQRFLC